MGIKKSTKKYFTNKLLRSCAKIKPKLNKLGITVKIEKKNFRNLCFLTHTRPERILRSKSNEIVENIPPALFEVAEVAKVAEVKQPQNPK